MRAAASRIALALCGLVAALLAVEIGVRVMNAREDRALFDRARLTAGRPLPKGPLGLGDLIRASELPDLIYELRPDLERVDYVGAAVSTNADGFRRTSPTAPAADTTYRVLGLGDSVMFGQGVSDGREYLSRLEKNLNRDDPSRDWQVLNAAVPGYNTAQEVAYLRARGLAFEPDLVLVGFVSNDVNLPSFLNRARDPFGLGYSAFATWLNAEQSDDSTGVLAPAPTQASRVFRVEADPEKVEARWRHLVGWSAVEASLNELKSLSDEHGFQVLLFSHRESEHSVAALEAARARGFATCDLAPRLANYMRDHGIKNYRDSELTVSETDPHPSPVHHRIASDGLQRALERLGIAKAPD